jgi:hypothetical protein
MGLALAFTDSNVIGANYTYFLRAVNDAGQSAPTGGSTSSPDGAMDFSISGNPLLELI